MIYQPVIFLMMLITGTACCEDHGQARTKHIVLQRGTLAAISCPIATTEEIVWKDLDWGRNLFFKMFFKPRDVDQNKSIPWGKYLIFTEVQGPRNQAYMCQTGTYTALINVTVTDEEPYNQLAIEYCQHGRPCALTCPSMNMVSQWPGVQWDDAVWLGKEWNGTQIQGEHPVMISPNVMAADILRNPSLVECKNRYKLTEEGHRLTGLPVGHVMYTSSNTMAMTIIPPYSKIVRPIQTDLTQNVFLPVIVGDPLTISCEGIGYDNWDDLFWLKKPCSSVRDCDTEFIPTEGRVTEQKQNTTLEKSVFGNPLSRALVFTKVDESDLNSVYYCKLESSGKHDLVNVYLQRGCKCIGNSPITSTGKRCLCINGR